jgi:spore maturation protein B
MSYYVIPVFILLIFIFSLKNKINAYDAFIEGVFEGMKIAYRLFPYILSMFFAIELLRISNIFYDLFNGIRIIPVELVLQGVFRPLSSQASMVNMISIFNQYGVDSKEGVVSSILQGSTDTTIFIISLYFGSVNIKKIRHALKASLITDFITFIIIILLYLLINLN